MTLGCRQSYREDLDYSHHVQQTWEFDDLNYGEIVQFESVFCEPDDTMSLRKKIVDDRIAANRDVLEIRTGTGLISILCLQQDASLVVATDINPAAIANAQYNAAALVPDEKLDARQTSSDSPTAFATLKSDEKFDLVLSCPPWQDGVIVKPADHATIDPGFAFTDSLLDGLSQHLNPGGRCLLALGNVSAIERLKVQAEKRNLEFKILDDRELESLESNFSPGMLVEIRTPLATQKVGADGEFTTPQASTTEENGEDDL